MEPLGIIALIIIGVTLGAVAFDYLVNWRKWVWVRFQFTKGSFFSIVKPRILIPIVKAPLESENSVMFEAKFSPECTSPCLRKQINKLYGLACDTVHDHSARIGWQPRHGAIRLYAYWYDKGDQEKWKFKYMATVEPGEKFLGKVSISNDMYHFGVYRDNHSPRYHDVRINGKSCEDNLYVRLFPYYGGTMAAPANMHIDIREK